MSSQCCLRLTQSTGVPAKPHMAFVMALPAVWSGVAASHICSHCCLPVPQSIGVRTTPNMAYAVALTARQTGQRERGRELIKEMELNGVR